MRHLLLTTTAAALLGGLTAAAAIDVRSDGSDGALVVTADTVIDLSRAVPGSWDADNSANAGLGIYDSSKWAVVFKYSSVNIAAGATVTFKNHASRAPVVWLVKGNVTIDGIVSLDGERGRVPPGLAEPGPGGFRGGPGFYADGVLMAAGFGPGGGASSLSGRNGAGGSFGSKGDETYFPSPAPYGNPSLVPIIGGSGGGGGGSGGGAGGGSILIASSGTLSIDANGALSSNGGLGGSWAGGGTGGGIRLVCDTLNGAGFVRAMGIQGGGVGRIRIERVTNSGTIQVVPDPSVVTLSSGATPLIWLPDSGPTVRIVSIGGQAAPADPRAEFGAQGADTVLPQVATTSVVVETTNVEQTSLVQVRVTPRANGNYTETQATNKVIVTESPLVVRWTANVPVKDGYSAMQVKVVRP